MILLQQDIPFDLQQYVPPLVSAVTTIVLFVVVLTVFYPIGKSIITRAVERSLRRREYDETLIGLAVSTTAAVFGIFAVAVAAAVAGFGAILAAFATLAGALTLAIGFAAQDIIANFVAGVFIIQDEAFTVGDRIEWDDNTGVVREIQMRVTKLDTLDNELVTVPNNDLATAVVINNVANDQRRVSVDFGIGYDEDIKQAQDTIIDTGSRVDGVLDDPEPTAPVKELGDSAVVLSGRVWTNTNESNVKAVRAQFVKTVKERFDSEGISIPYPNTELSGGVEVTTVGESEQALGD
ncbi:mechanosensitive ion channel family protein [Halobacteriaceae archaeon SHR40]|uniref:mechanosensitive ion channel family protein n=1 Tax=Halovenus amylolytica TaxID=2500550 RepID=UPI000FE32BF1